MSSATLKTSANLSLAVALPYAISFLTTPLLHLVSHTQLEILHVALLASLTDRFRKSWTTWDPKRGSGSRCLTLSPSSAPPKPIYDACMTASFQWSTWIRALGNAEINLFVDPGCVSTTKAGIRTIVWELPSQPAPVPASSASASASSLSDDEEDIFISIQEEVFSGPFGKKTISQNWQAALETEVKAPKQTSAATAFATLPRLDTKGISRSSSRTSMHSASSSISSISSFSSAHSSVSSATSVGSLGGIAYAPSPRKTVAPPAPRHKRAAQVPANVVHVDKSKGVVQKYDMGKTTVLTGGTMLGCAKKF